MHIDTGREMRGGQHQVLLLLKALREAGHQSRLLAREKGPLWSAAEVHGFPVYAAGIAEIWRHSRDADVVHAHDGRAHTIAAIASRCKFVVSRRVAFPVRRAVISKWKYQRAARFLAVSQFVARELEAAGIHKEKIDLVYDGVELLEAIQEWRAEYPAVALTSRDPQKGRDLVEQAAEVAGVRIVFSEDLARDLRRASMFVYITRSEGLGSAALLAMNRGVPVIASCVDGLTEVLTNGVSGILVTNDAREIAHAMRSILEDAAFSHRLIDQARARIAECFTVEHLVRGTLLSYARALAA
ncbi:MAG: glycosyltransferase family 4 protein [Bryobacteraceae bacterium]